jgi:hypothetical protein
MLFRVKGHSTYLICSDENVGWHDYCSENRRSYGDVMNRPLIIALFLVSMVPLYAHAQQPDMVKLKADAQKVVSIIKGDKTKTDAYCQINELAEQIGEAEQGKTARKLRSFPDK